MAQAPRTTVTYKLNGTNRDFQLPFEYLARKFVQVTLVGVDRKLLVLNIDYRFTQRTIITLTKNWGPADGYNLVEIRRYTSATERLVDFSDGSILRAYDLNTSQVQSLHIAEEGRDIATDTIGVNNDGDLDARARKIVNVGDGVNDFDAVNLRQQKQWAGSALNQADRANREADRSTQQANAAAGSAQASAKSAQGSSQARDAALQHRNQAEAFKNTAGTSQATAATSESNASKWAANPEDTLVADTRYSSLHYSRKSAASATASAKSASLANDKLTSATTQADRAKTEADRAKTESDKLGNMNSLGGALESVSGTTVTWKGKQVSKGGMYNLWADASNAEVSYSLCGNDGAQRLRLSASKNGDFWVTDDVAGKQRIGALKSGMLQANFGLTVKGSSIFEGSAAFKSTFQITSGLAQILAPAGGNARLGLYNSDGTQRGLVYAGTDNTVRVQAGSSLAAQFFSDGHSQFNDVTSNSVKTNGLTVNAGTGQNTILKPGVTAGPLMYGNCQLQLQAPDGSLPALGFHSAGRYAAALYLNDDNRLYLMNNGGGNARVITSDTFRSDIVSLTDADSIGSYALMAVGGGGGLNPGALVAGGNLRYSATGWINNGYGSSGTWRVMGCIANADGNGTDSITLCQRVG